MSILSLTPLKKLSSTQYKLLRLTGLGGALEFLDFTIYALFARYISQNFFPAEENFSSLLNTLGIFAVGYLARPLGGIIFGHFGDKYGRKNAFTTSAFVMAFSTLFMGCLPTYHQIGVMAPILLLILRLLQGISVGGEVPGATVFISEHYPKDRRGLAVGLIFMGVTLGNVIGSGLGYGLTTYLTNDEILKWGWRIPFIAGFILGLVAYFLRKKAIETPIFQEMLRNDEVHRIPIAKVIKTSFPQLMIGSGLTALSAITIFLFLYLPSYPPVQNYYKTSDLYLINIFNFFLLAFFTGIFGMLSDYIGRKKMMCGGSLMAIILGYFLFSFLLEKNNLGLLFFSTGITIVVGIVNGCYGCAIAELFPTKVRYTGMGISYNFGFAIFGGLSPFIITILLKWTQNPLAPYYLFTFFGGLTFLAASRMSIKQDR